MKHFASVNENKFMLPKKKSNTVLIFDTLAALMSKCITRSKPLAFTAYCAEYCSIVEIFKTQVTNLIVP